MITAAFEAIRSAILGVRQPVLVFLAGPNGSGKSTFFHSYLEPLQLTFVNADEIAQALREAALPPSADFDRLAFEKTEELRNLLLARRRSFCTETVFSDPQGAKLNFLQRARATGYAVFLIFIGVSDPELSAARVMQRVEAGGHDVPDDKLVERFPRTPPIFGLPYRLSMKHSYSTTVPTSSHSGWSRCIRTDRSSAARSPSRTGPRPCPVFEAANTDLNPLSAGRRRGHRPGRRRGSRR